MKPLRRHSCAYYSGWIHPDLLPLPDFLKDPNLLGSDPEARNLLDTKYRQIYRIQISKNGSDAGIFVYLDQSNLSFPLFRRSYAHRIRRISRKLCRCNIGTIVVLAALQNRGQAGKWTSVLVAREIPEVRQLPASDRHFLDIHPRQEFSDEIADTLGAELANLHSHGFFHGDLKSRHVLYRSDTRGFCFVDLEKCSQHKLWPGLFKDLMASRDIIQLLSSLPLDQRQKEFNERILSKYLERRELSARRKKRINSWIRLYVQQGGFQQGRTLLKNIELLVRNSPGKKAQANRSNVENG